VVPKVVGDRLIELTLKLAAFLRKKGRWGLGFAVMVYLQV
jgi:hypothetical protein